MKRGRGQSTVELIILAAISVTSVVVIINVMLKRPSNNAFTDHFNTYREMVAGSIVISDPPDDESFSED